MTWLTLSGVGSSVAAYAHRHGVGFEGPDGAKGVSCQEAAASAVEDIACHIGRYA